VTLVIFSFASRGPLRPTSERKETIRPGGALEPHNGRQPRATGLTDRLGVLIRLIWFTRTIDSITLASLNINGFKDRHKRKELHSILNRYDIICLQETHAQIAEVDKWRIWPHRDNLASHGSGASKGVITVCKEHLAMEEKTSLAGRIVSNFIKWGEKKIHVINVYAPNVNNTLAAKDQYKRFLVTLKGVLDESSESKILVGDFNIILNDILDTGVSNPASYYPELVEELEKLLMEYNLNDAWRTLYNDEPTFT